METLNYVRALRRSWYLVLIALVFGAAGGFFAYHQTAPKYRATVQLAVGYEKGQLADELSARALAAERAQSFIQIAGTAPVVAAARQQAGITDGAGLQITATGSGTDSLFNIVVVSRSQADVAPIANAYPQILIPQLVSLIGPLDSKVRINVISPALTPHGPFAPSLKRDLGLGLLAGLILGVVAALLVEVLDRTIRDSEDVADLLGLPAWGTIPDDAAKIPLPTVTHPRSARSEAYRQVRTSWLAQDPPAQVLALTSSAQGEGKTTVVTNLAAAMSRAGHSVIVIDADLRRPRVATVYGVSTEVAGLTEVLAGRALLSETIRHQGDGLPDILTAGVVPANPSELLSSSALPLLIKALRERYEYVILDTPPVLPVTDSLVVAPAVDAIVLVARVARTTRDRLRRTVRALERVQANVVGVVPNCANGAADGVYRYGYYYAYSDNNKKRRGGKRSSRADVPISH